MAKRTRPEDTTYSPCCTSPQITEEIIDKTEERLWKYLSKQAALEDSADRKRICRGIMKIFKKQIQG